MSRCKKTSIADFFVKSVSVTDVSKKILKACLSIYILLHSFWLYISNKPLILIALEKKQTKN